MGVPRQPIVGESRRRPGPRSQTIAPPYPLETNARVIDIIIPVYRGLDHTRRCIASVLQSHNRTLFEVIVIDDASPEARISDWLDTLAADGQITLLRNPENRGFVHSVNRGMAMHPERDVVLLNSDTEVANDWLDRLDACALKEGVATVTPFSNNATICSFPVFCVDNAMPDGYDVSSLDAVFRTVNAGRSVDIPTAVGFCMYIRRAALATLGPFDEIAFKRGYGEEVDFCCRASDLGWRHVLSADTFVFHAGGVSFGAEQPILSEAAQPVLRERHPNYPARVRHHLQVDPAGNLRRAVLLHLAAERRATLESRQHECGLVAPAATATIYTQLHLVHTLGGGIERWCRDFFSADTQRRNLVLQPLGRDRETVVGLALYERLDASEPLQVWSFDEPLVGTAASHAGYRAALDDLLRQHEVHALLVSSLIGHAVDALRTGLPTLLIQHDYAPFCPAINLNFHGGCPDCTPERLERCSRENHDFNLFPSQGAAQRLAVRERVLETLTAFPITLVQPSHGVAARLARIQPALGDAHFVTLPHGQDQVAPAGIEAPADSDDAGPFSILVLGMLAVSKGFRLLEQLLPRLPQHVELHLLGAGSLGQVLASDPRVHLVERYEPAELPTYFARIRPRLGLLLSIWPETYSYTLTELQSACIPTLATAVGAFAERIRDGETGFLAAPNLDAIAARLSELMASPAALRQVRKTLSALPTRGARAMVEDYDRLLPAARRWRVVAGEPPPVTRFDGDSIPARRMMDLQQAWRRAQAASDAQATNQLRLQRSEAARAALQTRLDAGRDQQAQHDARLAAAEARVDEILQSTSWRVTKPLRWLGRQRRRLARLAEWARPLLADRPRARHVLTALAGGWRAGGLASARLELALMAAPPAPTAAPAGDAGGEAQSASFAAWHAAIDAARALHLAQAARLPRQPRLSILVPVFDPPEVMLLAMIDSVRRQTYPQWELCLADDASTRPHVRRLLARCAGMDARIRVGFASDNGGVSRASNRALAMASGEFALLLDHDDLLEPHALLRVAQAVCGNDPDMFYSDEVLVGADGHSVEHFAFRPAFSAEYLRSHPYIVHLVGFRSALLRQIGGWNEDLRISQDYDLILRASEVARRIVHHPEILYRWRTHPASAGHNRMAEVMTTSRAVLGRHLARCGDAGEVSDGPCFNFFHTRYPQPTAARVAIIVPTRNHAALVAACIEGIEATCGEVDHRIVLVDHASDEPEALTYFDSLGERVMLQRQVGDFNFARINNLAVASLPPGFTHLLFLNNDVEAREPDWLGAMLELAAQADVGAVGAELLYPDGRTVQHAGVVVAACGIAENLGRFRHMGGAEVDQGYMGSLIATRELSAVTAACLLMRREVFDEIGGFDESLAVGYGDVDLCLRLRESGYRVLFCPRARLLHHESYSRGRHSGGDPHPVDTARFRTRWARYYETGDPYFSPNLSPNSPNWQFARPLPTNAAPLRRVAERGEDGRRRIRFSSTA
ncbi:MAG: glycosyltransferase [Rhodocyclaceae bacterium]|nr:glycosyltransferase [Rhodocyclaceae bacterium]